MSDITTVTQLAANPWSLLAGAVLFTAATAFVTALKKPKGEIDDKSRTSQQLTYMSNSIAEISTVTTDIIKLLATIAAQNNDSDDCEERIKRELEVVHNLVDDLTRVHRDPNSVFATVNLTTKVEKCISKLNNIEVTLARFK